jgi:Outer membrane protein beta-barrel domain
VNDELRAMTKNQRSFDKAVMMPSEMPSCRTNLRDAAEPHASQFRKHASVNCSFIGAARAKIAWTLQGLIMQRIVSLAALTLGVALTEIAAAAIMVAPAAAFTNNWSGVYIGAHLGGAWQSAPDWTYFNPNNGARFSLTPGGNLGAAGGLQGGYNWQLVPGWLLGVEGDISWISLAQTRTVPTIGPGKLRHNERYQSLAGQLAAANDVPEPVNLGVGASSGQGGFPSFRLLCA